MLLVPESPAVALAPVVLPALLVLLVGLVVEATSALLPAEPLSASCRSSSNELIEEPPPPW
jgi:hypothetical protein